MLSWFWSVFLFFFFKQKTAYEMRISDWSSDVCSSDLLDVAEDTPLLWVIRDELGLTGTKFGCGMAMCGACTVHVDGVATRSCVTAVGDVAGSAVTTIEAIDGKAAGAVQTAWEKLDVVQCGYCQSGQVMSAVALLSEKDRKSTRLNSSH